MIRRLGVIEIMAISEEKTCLYVPQLWDLTNRTAGLNVLTADLISEGGDPRGGATFD